MRIASAVLVLASVALAAAAGQEDAEDREVRVS